MLRIVYMKMRFVILIYILYDETGKMANNPENSKIPVNPVRGDFGFYIRTKMEIPPPIAQ